MMATTHALFGMAAGAVLAAVAPEHAPTAMLAGFAGGVVPDLDAYASHRRTLHAPVYGSVLAAGAVLAGVFVPGVLTVVIASALIGAALHAVMDIGGGGLSLEPWAEKPDRAVYSHFHQQWLAPRRYVAYDGSPGDLVLALAAGLPLLWLTAGNLRFLVAMTILLSVGYVAVRKRLLDILGAAIAHVPDRLQVVVPRRFEEARK
jgi:hypothetical protein